MCCSELQFDLERHCVGDLSADRRGVVEEHLKCCEACREQLSLLKQTIAVLEAAQRPDPGPSFNKALWERIDSVACRERIDKNRRGRKRRRLLHLFCGLAAAAASIIVVVFYGLSRPDSMVGSLSPQPPMQLAQITRQTGSQAWIGAEDKSLLKVGDWLYSGNRLRTGKQGRLELAWGGGADEVTLSVEPRTELVLEHSSAGGKQIRLIQGEAICQAKPQPAGKPLVVLAHDTELTVVGTTFSVTVIQDKMRLAVEEGTVQLRDSLGEVTMVERGFFAVAQKGTAATVAEDVNLARGVDARVRVRYGEGSWDVQRRKDGVFIRQTSSSCGDAGLFLGKPIYRSGLLTGRMRLLALGEATDKGEKPGIGFGFHHDNAEWEHAAKGKAMGDGIIDNRVTKADIGRWRRFNAVFQILPGGRVVADHLVWDEEGPPPLGRLRYDYTHEHEDGPRPERCNIGLTCRNASAEFTDLRVVPFDHPDGKVELALRKQVLAPWKEADCNIDFTNARATKPGEWHLYRTDKTILVQQARKKTPYSIVWFGNPRFRRGVFCGQKRYVAQDFPFAAPAKAEELARPRKWVQFKNTADVPAVFNNFVFHYPRQNRNPNSLTYDWLIYVSENPIDIWTNFVVYFELVDDKLVMFSTTWDEGRRFPWTWVRRVYGDRSDGTKVSRPICNIGLGATGMRMEYRNLRVIDLSDTPEPKHPAADEF